MQGPYSPPPEPAVTWQVQTFTEFGTPEEARDVAARWVKHHGGEALVYERNTRRGLRLRMIEKFGARTAGPPR